MYARGDMNRQNLLNDDDIDDDGNKEILDFYERNLQFLMMYPISFVHNHVLRKISVGLHNTLLFQSDWPEYATKMGITDNSLLAEIQASANSWNELPLHIAMKTVLSRNKSFGHIIVTLLKSQRYDILKILIPYVTEMIENSSTTNVKEVASIAKQPSEFKKLTYATDSSKDLSSQTVSCVNSLSNDNSEKLCTITANDVSVDQHKSAFNTLEQSSLNRDFTTVVQIFNSSVPHQTVREKDSLEEINLSPSAPREEKLSVFIQHTEFDCDKAKQLCGMLRKEGIIVTTLSDMDKLVMMDVGALNTVFEEVDFIVPIVSEKFLQQIHPRTYEKYLESADAMNNRTLYQLIMNEYRNNRCVNFRVRPVIVPDMKRQLLVNDSILTFSFRLWTEVPKLVRILKETKALIPQYPFH